ncbi:TM0106 family RecB-like putative nuclease [Zhihengliuella flava]|uniref:Uncharacterized protein n=1 Tax=Zhihengliuella flava TaxID=1285193 RepID=A0A931GFD6_9MICC|nr:bifunctional RecB family nuclease/DEAD/DEAH box helicase [Zhihengliuella flava]MBG6085278.1 uncharacterized protein [Zhihengliuella flava]
MFLSIDNDVLIHSASDLVTASTCEYATLVTLDDLLKRRPAPDVARDEMAARAAALGDDHEHRVLAQLIDQYGRWEPGRAGGVLELPAPGKSSPDVLDARRTETLAALTSGADVVFQGTFWDGQFVGYADFLIKNDDGRYAVWDTKLARHAKTTALLQIAAYGDQLRAEGFVPADEAVLVLGHGEHSRHAIEPLIAVFRERQSRFLDLTRQHRAQADPVDWGQPHLLVCGRCEYCAVEVEARDDLLRVARMSLPMRRRLHARGVTTMADLAELTSEDVGTPELPGAIARLRDQARMQCGIDHGDGTAPGDATLRYRLLADHMISRLPAPDTGDVFFDFEGDPMYQEPSGSSSHAGSWGLEYLFGVVEHPETHPGDHPPNPTAPVFRPFWAHSRAEERAAFIDFVTYIEERRARFPQLRVYHYASYEKTALRHLAARHAVCEDVIDRWLREGLLVDLLETVRSSLRISANSYSIKKLEPFYMGSAHRDGDVTDAGASVVAYAEYVSARDAGNAERAAEVLASISDYNEYDCVSTLRLRDWLLGLAAQFPGRSAAVSPSTDRTDTPEPEDTPPSASEQRLAEFLTAVPADRPLEPGEEAVALVAAATGFHRRERKQYWWAHFDRLESDPIEWQETRDVVIISSARVLADWEKPTPRARTLARTLSLRGTPAEGSDLRSGTTWFAMYAAPAPRELHDEAKGPYDAGARGGAFNLTVTEAVRHADGTVTLTAQERTRQGADPHDELPMALTPGQPIATKSLEEALGEVADDVAAHLPSLPSTAALDLIQRTPPRLTGPAALPVPAETATGHDFTGAVLGAVERLDRSYLAVQGPPGTGKTFVGSHVIAALVERGWKVGVVSQGHVTVDGMLTKAIGAGVDPERVAKEPKKGSNAQPAWANTSKKDITRLLGEAGGCLIGGTAWTLTGQAVPRCSLDLLVIDEAGQFSLANTLAVGVAAKNLLLLGDPQQLPQVTQGTHPVPVDDSALGWLSAGHATLPPEFGYFLSDSWRMHPQLCAAVSTLSYDGQLASAPAAAERRLDSVTPGVETVLVPHSGNTVSSPEEADAVVRLVREHLGLTWEDEGGARPVEPADVIVVAAYNAQVQVLRAALNEAGYDGVAVGTVDKFQGQEAPLAIVSLACSAPADAARGLEFLLNQNRLNVAVSRGKWKAFIVRSPQLTNYLPATPEGMAALGAFLQLSPTPTQRPAPQT